VLLLVNEFVTVRLHAMARRTTELIKGGSVRFNSNKQVLFSSDVQKLAMYSPSSPLMLMYGF